MIGAEFLPRAGCQIPARGEPCTAGDLVIIFWVGVLDVDLITSLDYSECCQLLAMGNSHSATTAPPCEVAHGGVFLCRRRAGAHLRSLPSGDISWR